jgi:hypothetical protein
MTNPTVFISGWAIVITAMAAIARANYVSWIHDGPSDFGIAANWADISIPSNGHYVPRNFDNVYFKQPTTTAWTGAVTFQRRQDDRLNHRSKL